MVSINLKRFALTSIVSVVVAATSFFLIKGTIPTSITAYHFLSSLIFATAILLSSSDRVKIKNPEQYLYVLIIIILQLLILSDGGLFIGMMGLGGVYFYFIGPITGIVTFLLFNQLIAIEAKKYHYFTLAVINFTIPFIVNQMENWQTFSPSKNIHSIYLIVWQALTGISLSIIIWTKTNKKSPTHNSA